MQILARFAHWVEGPISDDLFEKWLQEWGALWTDVHQLAEWQDADLLLLLRRALCHHDGFVRGETLQLVGFHYDLSGDAELLEHVRSLLLSDVNEHVRLTAAAVLGVQADAWDDALVRALTDDSDEDVRRVAFESLLKLFRLGPGPEARWLGEIEAGRLTPTLDALHAIAARYDL
ncbi:HEAT repeat domain-containing protein [Deinococcus sp. YIM 134068]|uniref:HEAT repeat domain-containing protein n=1 Tax=Deinococcus lichenicola TaxID=3118910 RepID=UPI002F9373DD